MLHEHQEQIKYLGMYERFVFVKDEFALMEFNMLIIIIVYSNLHCMHLYNFLFPVKWI